MSPERGQSVGSIAVQLEAKFASLLIKRLEANVRLEPAEPCIRTGDGLIDTPGLVEHSAPVDIEGADQASEVTRSENLGVVGEQDLLGPTETLLGRRMFSRVPEDVSQVDQRLSELDTHARQSLGIDSLANLDGLLKVKQYLVGRLRIEGGCIVVMTNGQLILKAGVLGSRPGESFGQFDGLSTELTWPDRGDYRSDRQRALTGNRHGP